MDWFRFRFRFGVGQGWKRVIGGVGVGFWLDLPFN